MPIMSDPENKETDIVYFFNNDDIHCNYGIDFDMSCVGVYRANVIIANFVATKTYIVGSSLSLKFRNLKLMSFPISAKPQVYLYHKESLYEYTCPVLSMEKLENDLLTNVIIEIDILNSAYVYTELKISFMNSIPIPRGGKIHI